MNHLTARAAFTEGFLYGQRHRFAPERQGVHWAWEDSTVRVQVQSMAKDNPTDSAAWAGGVAFINAALGARKCAHLSCVSIGEAVLALVAENERLREALTPSGPTKAAYMGEFEFNVDTGSDEGGNDRSMDVAVPWTTTKEIMAAIAKRAGVELVPEVHP